MLHSVVDMVIQPIYPVEMQINRHLQYVTNWKISSKVTGAGEY